MKSIKTILCVAVGIFLFLASVACVFSAEVPEMLPGNFPSFTTPDATSTEEWERRRVELREQLRNRLGDWPPLFTPEPKIENREKRDGYTLEKITYDNGAGHMVYGYVMIPEGRTQPGPAILYHHYHGGRYPQGKEEVLVQAFTKDVEHQLVTGEELVRAGYVVLCIDAYAFGERRWQGPGGEQDEGRDTEHALFKMFLWEGKTLWGMMVRDDVLALNYLVSRPEVDPDRVGAMGMSMGSTRTWWLAAMDDRIKCAVSVCCLTRYQDLMAGGLQAHGFYYWVPGLLKDGIDMESVIGLIAPRAHLTLTGDADNGSPASGVEKINAFQERLYRVYGAKDHFRGVLYPGVGHVYTPAMWEETLEWLAGKL